MGAREMRSYTRCGNNDGVEGSKGRGGRSVYSQKAATASQYHALAASPPCSLPVDKDVFLVLPQAAEIP